MSHKERASSKETVKIAAGYRRGGSEKVGVMGRFRAILRGPDGKIKEVRSGRNIFTDLGSAFVADALALTQNFTDPPLGMKLGTGVVAPDKGDDDLGTPLAGSFKTFDGTYPRDDAPETDQVNYRVTWAAGEATQSGLSECVVKSADGTTDAISRFLLSPVVNKGASDTLEVTLSVDFDGV